MKVLILTSLLCAATAWPATRRGRFGIPVSDDVVVGRGFVSAPEVQNFHSKRDAPRSHVTPIYQRPEECPPGHMMNSDGTCGVPVVNRKIFVFAAKPTPQEVITGPVPEPEVNIDVILVKTPTQPEDPNPIVVPPAEQKTVVYVLSKRPETDQEVIEVPSQPQDPEVFFVNYNDGDNPTLPGGISLQEALQQSAISPQGVIGGDDGGSGQRYNNYI